MAAAAVCVPAPPAVSTGSAVAAVQPAGAGGAPIPGHSSSISTACSAGDSASAQLSLAISVLRVRQVHVEGRRCHVRMLRCLGRNVDTMVSKYEGTGDSHILICQCPFGMAVASVIGSCALPRFVYKVWAIGRGPEIRAELQHRCHGAKLVFGRITRKYVARDKVSTQPLHSRLALTTVCV